MWKLYADPAGIAIKTKFQSLANSFTDSADIYIGQVNYTDYDSEIIPESNVFAPFLYKRSSFQHEREVRAIVDGNLPVKDNNRIQSNGDGRYIAIDISTLIHEVVVPPFTQEWFFKLAQSISVRYGLTVPVNKSTLEGTPTFG